MSDFSSRAYQLSTYRTAFAIAEAALAKAEVWCGHGYIDHHDEAIALVLAAAGQPLDADASILDAPYPEEHRALLADYLKRRTIDRLPVAYIIGEAWLGPCLFRCDARALVPRSPIAEIVLRELSPWWMNARPPGRIVDVCCGGGSLGILAAHVFPEAQVSLLDIDPQALQLAAENVAAHELDQRITLIEADLLSPMAAGSCDVILANPPYVDAPEMASLAPEYAHEPRHALAAGEDGLDLIPALVRGAAAALTADGILLLEVGNSWHALEAKYPGVSFLWVELESGGEGVAVFTRQDLLTWLSQIDHSSSEE